MQKKYNLWDQFPKKNSHLPTDHRHFRWVVEAIFPLSLMIIAATLVVVPTGLDVAARIVLFVFSSCVILWATTAINSAYVALVGVLALVLSGAAPQKSLFLALGSDVIWLMIGAFVLGGAVQQTGLATRLTTFVVSRVSTLGGVFWLLTTVLIPLALVIPSTSGRAAAALPVFRSIAASAQDQTITRALAILVPSIILVSTSASLIAAGSHLIAVDLLEQFSGQRISYTQWLIYGLPFGIVASYVTALVIMQMFLNPEQRSRKITINVKQKNKFNHSEKTTLIIIVLMVCLWLSEQLHGLEIATVTVTGAILLTAPKIGVLNWKAAMNAVSWNLIIFVGAALVLGESLISSGAASWIIDIFFSSSAFLSKNDPATVLLVFSFITLTSHAYITSHSARAAALVPALLYMADSLGLNPVTLMFIGIVGMNYCLTFPVSSKALLMFYEIDEETYKPADLLRLSSILLLMHILLIIGFYFAYWQWIGLAL